MARKDYPFNRRDSKKMTNLVTNLIVGTALAPFALLDTVSSKYPTTLSSKPVYVKSPFNHRRFKTVQIIAGLLFLLAPLGGSLLSYYAEWWTFFVLICLCPLEGFLSFLMFFDFGNEIKYGFIFDNNNRKNLLKQLNTCNFAYKFSFIIIALNLCYYLPIAISYFIGYSVFFDINLFDPLYYLDYSYPSYDFTLSKHILPSLFWLSSEICDATSISIIILIIMICAKGYALIHIYKEFKGLRKSLVQNESIQQIIKNKNCTDISKLCYLHEQKNDDAYLSFDNGCTVKAIKSKEIDECGFTLSTKDKKKHTYKFGDYVSSKSELITKGVNLSKISKDINEKLREYDLAMILSGEILQRKDCDLLDQLIQEE